VEIGEKPRNIGVWHLADRWDVCIIADEQTYFFMKLDKLLLLPLHAELMVDNEPFTYAGKSTFELDGGDERYWMFSTDGGMLAVSPDDEEIVSYRTVDEELEPEGETLGYQGKDYEFSYEDVGLVRSVEGDARVEPDERYTFTDYEADDGETIRIVKNENSGEAIAFLGSLVGEDDVVVVE